MKTKTVFFLMIFFHVLPTSGMEKEQSLHQAVAAGDLTQVQELIGHVKKKDTWDLTPLHVASFHDQPEVMQFLLENGGEPVVDEPSSSGSTALHFAAMFGSLDSARLLLAHHAEADKKDHQDRVPLHEAAWHGHPGVVDLLLQAGVPVDPVAKHNGTPLDMVALRGNAAIARLLLARGADRKANSTLWQGTPLTMASWFGHTGVVRALLEQRVYEIDKKDESGKTAFDYVFSFYSHSKIDILACLLCYAVSSKIAKEQEAKKSIGEQVAYQEKARENKVAFFLANPACVYSQQALKKVLPQANDTQLDGLIAHCSDELLMTSEPFIAKMGGYDEAVQRITACRVSQVHTFFRTKDGAGPSLKDRAKESEIKPNEVRLAVHEEVTKRLEKYVPTQHATSDEPKRE